MAILEQKSKFNLFGAETLIKANYYAPSVHCSYYSLFQKLKCEIVKKSGKTHEELSEECKGKSSHKYIISTFLEFISDRTERRGLENEINDLKQLRIDSDYNNIQIDISIGQKALDLSKSIQDEIK